MYEYLLAILLIIAIVLFANLAMPGLTRGSRGMKSDWLNTTKDGIAKPFQKEDDQRSNLRQLVEGLAQKTKQPNIRGRIQHDNATRKLIHFSYKGVLLFQHALSLLCYSSNDLSQQKIWSF